MEAIIGIVVFVVALASVLAKQSGQKKGKSAPQKRSAAAQKAYTQHHAATASKAQKAKDDILTRAKRNVAEYQEDKLDEPYQPVEDISEPETEDTILYQDLEDGEGLMAAVYEVMVKGVDCSVPFERDFIAEGQEILNRIYS